MAGTREGGLQTAATNKQRYGLDFYKKIGHAGGVKSTNRGWSSTPEGKAILSEAGRKGGRISRRKKVQS